MKLKHISWNTWSDIVQSINDKNPQSSNFQEVTYNSEDVLVTIFYHEGRLFSMNLYISSQEDIYLINPIFLP